MKNTGLIAGLARVLSISKRCIFYKPLTNKRFVLPFILIACTFASEWLSLSVMKLISEFYFVITTRNSAGYFSCLKFSVIVITALALLNAIINTCTDACSLQWREDLVKAIQRAYFRGKSSYDVINGIGCTGCDNPDQRIVQDAQKFTSLSAKLIARLIPLPVVIIYYTWFLWSVYGWLAPMLCYGYFLISTLVISILTKRLIPVIYDQDALEGDFRFQHSRYRINVEAIAYLDGERTEGDKLEKSFYQLCANTRLLIKKRVPLYFFVSWFGGLGAIGNSHSA